VSSVTGYGFISDNQASALALIVSPRRDAGRDELSDTD
jgi:hypothetical protein